MNDEEIRSLLHDARETAPMPDEVAARLADALARATEERAAHGGTVVPLRRRVRMPLAAVAAAVVLLAGVAFGVGQLGDLDSNGGNQAAKAGGQQDSSLAASEPAAPHSSARTNQPAAGQPVALSSAHFHAGVAALLARHTALEGVAGSAATPGPQDLGALRKPAACILPTGLAGARTRLVRLDGRPAVLVIHPRTRAGRLVEALACGGDQVLARTTLRH